MLDNAIDASAYPLPKNEKAAKRGRKIGLGVIGWAHTLAKSGIPYDSDRAIIMAEEVMSFISNHALQASRELAKQRGPFPDFDKSTYARRGEPAVRNATRTTVPPTGTISIIADTACSARAAGRPVDVTSCPDAIARVLKRFITDNRQDNDKKPGEDICLKCGGRREPGRCGVCHSCGAGKCEGYETMELL